MLESLQNKKAFMQMSFAWIFGLIVGVIILVLAIYIATQMASTEELSIDVQTSKDVGVLLNPLEIGFQEGVKTFLTLPKETRIYGGCSTEPEDIFGRQTILIQQESFGDWSETKTKVSFFNKYIFAQTPTQGKNFVIFSKPFEYPFKVADLTYIIPLEEKYCLLNAPESITDEIHKLKLNDILKNVTSMTGCEETDNIVCFSNSGFGSNDCNTSINLNQKKIRKRDIVETEEEDYEIVETDGTYYSDSLIYAAIFSNYSLYDCQVKRLMLRAKSLAELYIKKAQFVSSRNCNTHLDLEGLRAKTEDASKFSIFVGSNIGIVEDVNESNYWAECKLW